MLKRVLKIGTWILGIAAGILIVMYIGVSLMIGLDINNISKSAMERFDGGRIDTLIAFVDCQSCSFKDRNRAVWALGQLRDKRALPILYKYYNGGPCSHMHMICQYELSKAIRWTEGNSFILPQIWRVMLQDEKSKLSRAGLKS